MFGTCQGLDNKNRLSSIKVSGQRPSRRRDRRHCEEGITLIADRLRGSRFAASRAALLLALATLSGTTGATSLFGQETHIDTPYRWIEQGMRFAVSPGYVFTSRGSLNLGPGSTPTGAGRFRIRVSNPLTFEINATYGNSNRFILYPLAEGGPATVDTVNSGWILAEAAVQFTFTGARTWHGIQPYLIFGGGGIFALNEEVSPLEEVIDDLSPYVYEVGSAPDFLAAAGIEWILSRKVGLSFEARDHVWRLKAPEIFFTPEILEIILETGAPAPSESEWTNNVELSLSVWFYP